MMKRSQAILIAFAAALAMLGIARVFLLVGMVENEGTSLCRSEFTYFQWMYSFPSIVELFRIPYGNDFYEHQPLFYWLLRCWRHLCGETKLALRVLPFFFYALNTLSVVWICSRERASLLSTCLITALCVVLPAYVGFGVYIREYSLLCFISTLCFYSFLKIFDEGRSVGSRSLALFVALALLGVATFTAFFGPLFVLFGALIFSKRLSRGQTRAMVAGFCLLVPYFLQKVWIILHVRKYFTEPDLGSLGEELPRLLGLGNEGSSWLVLAVGASLVLLMLPVLGRRIEWRLRRRGDSALMLMMFLAMSTFVVLKSLHWTEMSSRYISFIYPAGVLLLLRQRGSTRLGQTGLASLVAIYGLVLSQSLPSFERQAEPERTMSRIEPGLPVGRTVIYTNRLNDMACRYGSYFNTLFAERGKSIEFGFLWDGLAEVERPGRRDPIRFLVEAAEPNQIPEIKHLLRSDRVREPLEIDVSDGPYLFFVAR